VENEHPWLEVTFPSGERDYLRLNLALTTIGRSEQNVVELLDPKLSRFHCEIERRGNDFFLRDCNSRNGTRINDEPVHIPRRLEAGDRIKLGHSVLVFLRARPPQVTRNEAVAFQPIRSEEETTIHVETQVNPRGPTRGFDPRQTARLTALTPHEGGTWGQLAKVAQRVLRAERRAEVIEETLTAVRAMLQARGAYLAERDGDSQLACVGRQGLDDVGLRYVEELAVRAVANGEPVFDGHRGIALPLGDGKPPHGALAAYDLPRAIGKSSEAMQALTNLAELTARTLSGSLQVEEVRRSERDREASRIAQDLQELLRPERLPAAEGLELGVASRGAGPGFWDALRLPPRAGREELLLAVGAVPRGEPRRGLRRRGERGLLATVAQAELKGALRATARATASLSEVLQRLAGSACGTNLAPEAALALFRYDPQDHVLRSAGAGHPLLLLRGGGEVETLPTVAEPLGASCPPCAEHRIHWSPGDVLLAVSHLPPSLDPEVLPAMLDALATGDPPANELAAQIVDDLAEHAVSEWDLPTALVIRNLA